MNTLFRITEPNVLSVSSSRDDAHEPQVTWFVGYAPQKEAELDARVLIATLNVAGPGGRGGIQVAALLWDDSGATHDDESFEAAFVESDAVGVLYAFARAGLRSVLTIVESVTEVPGKAPTPEIGQLSRIAADSAV